MTSTEGMTNLPVKFTSDGGRNLVLLTMLQNHEKKTVEMVRRPEHGQILVLKKSTFHEEYFLMSSVFISCSYSSSQLCFILMFLIICVLSLEHNMLGL